MLKIKGTEIQQALTELLMQALGHRTRCRYVPEALDAGCDGAAGRRRSTRAPLAGHYFNMRKTSIYGGSNEIQKNIIAQLILGL